MFYDPFRLIWASLARRILGKIAILSNATDPCANVQRVSAALHLVDLAGSRQLRLRPSLPVILWFILL